MLALAFVAALSLTPDPIEVAPKETVTIQVNTDPGRWFLYGAGLSAEDKAIAVAQGRLLPREERGKVKVTGVRKGRTRLILEYVSGLSVYRVPVADIIVGDPCVPPAVALSVQQARLAAGEELTVAAMTTGTDVRIEWYEGARFRRLGPAYTVRDRPPGTYRFTARVSNRCGTAVSEELVVEVVPPRRRSVRR